MNTDRFKFRCWDKRSKRYAEGYVIGDDGWAYCLGDVGDEWYELTPNEEVIIEQCTGLRDRNGNLIYAGDIIKVVDGCVHLGKTFEVVDSMIRWEMRDLSNNEYDTLMCGICVEIIGNIHDDQFRGKDGE